MNTAWFALSALVAAAFVASVVTLLRRIYDTLQEISKDIQDLRQFSLNPRTRMSRIEARSGPISPEKSLQRLGRASKARRVVVGGDQDSELYASLNRTNPAMVDNE